MTRELSLSQLTTELTDFLGLPADLDLPPLHSIDCKRNIHTGWQVRAHLNYRGDAQAYEAVAAWARYAGGEVTIGKPYVGSIQPSGLQRTVSTQIVVAEVPIELVACVDGLFVAPQTVDLDVVIA